MNIGEAPATSAVETKPAPAADEDGEERRMVNIAVKPCAGVDPETLYKKITDTVKGEPASKVKWDETCKVDGGKIHASFTIAVEADFDEEVMEWIEYMEDEVESSQVTFQAALEWLNWIGYIQFPVSLILYVVVFSYVIDWFYLDSSYLMPEISWIWVYSAR